MIIRILLIISMNSSRYIKKFREKINIEFQISATASLLTTSIFASSLDGDDEFSADRLFWFLKSLILMRYRINVYAFKKRGRTSISNKPHDYTEYSSCPLFHNFSEASARTTTNYHKTLPTPLTYHFFLFGFSSFSALANLMRSSLPLRIKRERINFVYPFHLPPILRNILIFYPLRGLCVEYLV
jgi:hypothetical protein